MTSDLTVLTSVSRLYATKRIRQHVKTGRLIKSPYGLETHFQVQIVELTGFGHLCGCLGRLTERPFSFVIRGEPLPAIDLNNARRLLHPDPETGECATFAEAPRRWFAVDIDKVTCPAATSPVEDPADAIEYLIRLLPPELADASCWWQFTSSQSLPGYEDKLSARLWFWLAEPFDDAALTRWALNANKGFGWQLVDPALYRTVQPHYVAAPIFEGEMRDPLPVRHGVRRGLDEAVSLLIPEPSAEDPYVAGDGYVGLGVEGHLAQIGGDRGFRQPMLSAIAAYFATAGADADPEPIKNRVREAIDRARPGGRTEADLARYRSDRHLNGIVGWLRVRERANPRPPRKDFFEMLDGLGSSVPVGPERHQAVRVVAEHLLRRLDRCPHLAAALVKSWNEVCCVPPLDVQKVDDIVHKAAMRQLRAIQEATHVPG